jgi:hypothetical protein
MSIRAIAKGAQGTAIKLLQLRNFKHIASGPAHMTSVAKEQQRAIAPACPGEVVQDKDEALALTRRATGKFHDMQLMLKIQMLQRFVKQHETRVLRP